MGSIPEKKSTAIKVTRAVASLGACVVFALGFIAIARLFEGKYAPESQPIIIVSALISFGASGYYLVRTAMLKCRPDKYRVPTGKEILSDLAVAAPGLLFSVPFIFVSVTGGLTSMEERLFAGAMAFPGLVFPTLRPRKAQPDLRPGSAPTAKGDGETRAQDSGDAIRTNQRNVDDLKTQGGTGQK